MQCSDKLDVQGSEQVEDLLFGLEIFRNMRVPKKSVIYKVFSGEANYLEAIENLGWWEASDGTRLPLRRVLVEARRFGTDVHALLTLAV